MNSMKYNTMKCHAMLCNAMQCNAMILRKELPSGVFMRLLCNSRLERNLQMFVFNEVGKPKDLEKEYI